MWLLVLPLPPGFLAHILGRAGEFCIATERAISAAVRARALSR
jgi:hypothetical protein